MNDKYFQQIKKTYKHFKEVSIAEFFEKNRHLLGFDNPRKALLMAVKELVDNSLDACEEAKILPEVKIRIRETSEGRYLIRVEDNGPGIPKDHVPNVYGKFLYGSKFHRYITTRGKQGIGVSAITLYSQLTTGKPVKILTKTPMDDKAHFFEIKIDTKKNEPIIVKYEELDSKKEHGTTVEVEIEGKYVRGKLSVDEYIRLTALVNPHANITYINPKNEKFVYKRVTTQIPELKEIKPHPYGIEIGVLARMLADTKYKDMIKFLTKEFSSIGMQTAKEILKKAKIDPRKNPKRLADEEIERLYDALMNTKIRAPPTKVLVTIGEELIRESLIREFDPEFVVARKRPPSTYRGMPFIVEVGIAYGGEIKESKAQIFRFANRVPLLYRSGECAITYAIKEFNWKKYKIKTGDDNIPQEPMIIFVHLSSVWIPFTSESKEAIAPYPEIVKGIKAALRDAVKQLQIYLNKRRLTEEIEDKYLALYGYGLEMSKALSELTSVSEEEIKNLVVLRLRERVIEDLSEILGTVKDLRVLMQQGKMQEVKKLLKKFLGKVLDLNLVTEEDFMKIISKNS